MNKRGCYDEAVSRIGWKISEIDGANGDFPGERQLKDAVV